jgi:hypothetical protein
MDQDDMLDKMYGIEFGLKVSNKSVIKFTSDIEKANIHICEVCLAGIEKLRVSSE